MSKNLQTDRILYNGKPGPFYLDVEDKTDGPDGTTKPITKDILREMIVANFPDLQKVKDAGLLNELQSVKQQQSQILERLNSPIDTRLSGSNVEELATKGCESISISRTGTLDLGVYETVFDLVGRECELQSLAIGTDYSAISIYIEPYDVNGDTISTIGVASSNGRIYTPSPMNLDRHSGGTNDFFRNQIYDEENGVYVVTMMRGMVFPNGFRIRIRNQNTSNDRNVALSGLVSTKY